MWRITGFSSYFLTEQLRKRQLQYSTAISGKQEQEPRWKECIDLATGSLSTGSGALYVRKYFKKESKASALQMVNAIKVEFEEILKKVPWMDETTRTAGLSKVKSMVTHIGYPDELMDDNKLTDFYKTVKVDENKYLESILSINIFGTDRAFKKLREPVNKTDWITHSKPAVVNAFYSSIENSIRELILLWFSGQPAQIEFSHVSKLIFDFQNSPPVFFKANSSQPNGQSISTMELSASSSDTKSRMDLTIKDVNLIRMVISTCVMKC